MLRSWLLGKTGRNAGTGIKGRSGHDARRLSLEPLEDRSLLSVSLLPIAPPVAISLGGAPASIVAGPGQTAAAATHFTLSLQSNVPAGAAVPVIATALTGKNFPAFGYSGTVNVSTTNSSDVFPATVTFQNGFATFRVTFATANTPDTLTITDSKTATLTGEVLVNVGAQAVATKYDIDLVSSTPAPWAAPTVLGPQGLTSPTWAPNVVAGASVPVTVTALDSQNDPVTTYADTANVAISDTGTGATAPSTVTFADGSVRFDVTFVTPGAQSVTVSDQTNTPALTGTLNVNVVAPVVAAKYVISLLPTATAGGETVLPLPTPSGTPNVAAGTPVTVAVAALDAQNHPDLTYDGTANVVVSDTGTGVSYPATVTFASGFAKFNVTFVTAGAQTVMVTDQNNTALTATLNVNVVVPGVAAKYVIHLAPPASTSPILPPSATGAASVPAGVPVAVDVTALDGFNKTATGYDGTANVTISDTGAGVSYPATVTFVSGVATFNVTFVTAGPQTVMVTDPTNPTALTATLKVNVVAPVAATHFAVPLPLLVPQGKPVTVQLEALGANNKLASGYNGTVTVTSSDTGTGVTYPSTVTFTGGVASLTITFVTKGKQSVTVTDDTGSTPVTGVGYTWVGLPPIVGPGPGAQT